MNLAVSSCLEGFCGHSLVHPSTLLPGSGSPEAQEAALELLNAALSGPLEKTLSSGRPAPVGEGTGELLLERGLLKRKIGLAVTRLSGFRTHCCSMLQQVR